MSTVQVNYLEMSNFGLHINKHCQGDLVVVRVVDVDVRCLLLSVVSGGQGTGLVLHCSARREVSEVSEVTEALVALTKDKRENRIL